MNEIGKKEGRAEGKKGRNKATKKKGKAGENKRRKKNCYQYQ